MNSIKKVFLRVVILLSLSFGLKSCIQDLLDFEFEELIWTPELSFPLVKTTFTLEDLISEIDPDGFIQEEDGAITIVYAIDFPSRSASQLFNVPDQNFEIQFPLPPDNILEYNATGQTTYTIDINFPFEAENEQFDSLWLLGGTFLVSIDEDFPADGDIVLDFVNTKNRTSNETLVVDFGCEYNIAQTVQFYDESVNLANTGIVLNNDDGFGGVTRNDFLLRFTITLNQNVDNPQNISLANEVLLRMDLQGLQFEALFGDLGSRDFNSNENTIDLSFFDQIAEIGEGGSLFLSNASLNVLFQNSFGLPVEADFSDLYFVNREDERENLDYTGNRLIAGPNYSQIGQSLATEISFNRDNSNFAELFQQLPKALNYTFNGTLNPGDQENNNFVLSTSQLDMSVQARVPFHGSFSNLTTSENILVSGESLSGVISGSLEIKTINEMPLEVLLTAYLVDENDNELALLTKGPNDAIAVLLPRLESITSLTLDEEAITAFPNTAKIKMILSLSTEGHETNTEVKISSSQTIDITIGANVKLEIKPLEGGSDDQ